MQISTLLISAATILRLTSALPAGESSGDVPKNDKLFSYSKNAQGRIKAFYNAWGNRGEVFGADDMPIKRDLGPRIVGD